MLRQSCKLLTRMLSSKRFIVLTFSVTLVYIYAIDQRHNENAWSDKKRKIVLILAYYRSGSTFLGHLFNKNPDAFYLFEPLLPFGFQCDKFAEERMEFLKNISLCKFEMVPEIHKRVHEILHYEEKYSRCIPTNICFSEISPQSVITHYRSVCQLDGLKMDNATLTELLQASVHQRQFKFPIVSQEQERQRCGPPYNTLLESALCLTSKITAYKMIRVCNMSHIKKLYHELKLAGKDVYIIHLIRDVRATLSSGFKLELDRDQMDEESKALCDRYRDKIKFFKNDHNSELITDRKLLEIRNEDLTMNPMDNAELIYRFIGEKLHKDVRKWIWKNSIASEEVLDWYHRRLAMATTRQESAKIQVELEKHRKQMRSAYGTARIPSKVIYKWRTMLTMKETNFIQDQCSDVLEHYKYRLIQDESELHNESIRTW